MSPRRTTPGVRWLGLWTLLTAGVVSVLFACTEEKVTGVNVTSLSVLPREVSVVEGEERRLTATVEGDAGDDLPTDLVTWRSRNDAVATVDSTGSVEAQGPGTTAIVATLEGVSDSATVRVLGPALLVTSPDSVALFAAAGGAEPRNAVVQVVHEGAGPLQGLAASVAYEAGAASGWLSAELSDTETPATLSIVADGGRLEAGVQRGSVSITSPDASNAPVTVQVTLSLGGIAVTESGGRTVVSEDGSSDDIDVVLNARPTSDVVLEFSSADEGEVAVSPDRITFTPSDWDQPQRVTVTGQDDQSVDGDQETEVRAEVVASQSDDAFDDLPGFGVTVTTRDDDESGLRVTESAGGTRVSETGSSDDVTISLDRAPTSDVVVQIRSVDATEVTVGPSSFTFTPVTWDVPRTLTVTGVDDSEADGNKETPVVISIDDASSDDAFDALPDVIVDVTTIDDDQPSMSVEESGGSTVVSESGSTDELTVVLDAAPSSDVLLRITSSDPGEATASPATLSFTATSWSTPQRVQVTGVDDDATDGDQGIDLTVAVEAASSDDAFDDLPDVVVAVVVTDDDGAGYTVTETGGESVVSEGGSTDQLSVVLDATPTSNVVLEVSSGDPGEVTVSPSRLTFTPDDARTVQTVTLTGVPDASVDGDQVTSVVLSVDGPASDDAFDNLSDRGVSVTTRDADAAGFTVSESGGSTVVTEAAGPGNTDDFTVVLDVAPTSGVVVRTTRSDLSEASVSPTTLTFTASNWSVPQAVTVTGTDDTDIDGDVQSTITVAIDATRSDDAFDSEPDQVVDVVTIDDDENRPPPALVTEESAGTTRVTEAPGSDRRDSFTVALSRAPSSNVVLDVRSENAFEVSVVSASTIVFTPQNWATPRTVTVEAVNDLLPDGNRSVDVTVSVDSSASAEEFQGLSRAIDVTTIDNDNIIGSGGR